MKANTKKFQLFEFSAGMKLSKVNIDRLLECLDKAFKSSGNPVHVWKAIYFCDKAEEPLPEWVIAYLAQCSKRMIFDERDTKDLRKVLPKVLGFPGRARGTKKSGPGKLLKPGPPEDKFSFTTKFVNHVMQGDDPETARDNACNDMSPEFADKYDDKALVQILINTMGLVETPLTPNQWKTRVYRWVAEHFVQLTLWDANATEDGRERARALAKKAWGR
jgi:hypothetical protein